MRKFPDAAGFSQGGFSVPVGNGSSQTGFIPPTDSGVPASALGLVQFNFADTPSPEMKIKHAEILKDKAALEAERNEAISKAEAIELQYNESQTELGEAQNNLQEAMKEINGLKRSQEQLNAELANASRGSEGAQQAHKAEVAKLRSEAENAQKALNAELAKVRLEAENTKKALTADLANARSGTENVQRELNNLRGSTAETIARLNNEVHQRDRRAIPFPQRQGNRVWIMAVVWGNQFIYDENVINRCYQFAHSKQRFQFNNDWFGGDNMPGARKTGLVLYKYDNSGLIRYLYGWEHDTYGFDGW